MSDAIKHECGVAMLRLLKPLAFYQKKYGTAFYGLNKMYLLMEKQHNRGQDGVGLANIKIDVPPGRRYISRKRSIATNPIQDVFKQANKRFVDLQDKNPEKLKTITPEELEKQRTNSAIRTDLILSAEVIAISYAVVADNSFLERAIILVVIGIGITFCVYGAVALIVKADDVGEYMARNGQFSATKTIGNAITGSVTTGRNCPTPASTTLSMPSSRSPVTVRAIPSTTP